MSFATKLCRDRLKTLSMLALVAVFVTAMCAPWEIVIRESGYATTKLTAKTQWSPVFLPPAPRYYYEGDPQSVRLMWVPLGFTWLAIAGIYGLSFFLLKKSPDSKQPAATGTAFYKKN